MKTLLTVLAISLCTTAMHAQKRSVSATPAKQSPRKEVKAQKTTVAAQRAYEERMRLYQYKQTDTRGWIYNTNKMPDGKGGC